VRCIIILLLLLLILSCWGLFEACRVWLCTSFTVHMYVLCRYVGDFSIIKFNVSQVSETPKRRCNISVFNPTIKRISGSV